MYGVTLYEMYERKRPYFNIHSNKDVIQLIQRGGRLPVPEAMPKSLQPLYSKCFSDNPKDRPSMKELLVELEKTCA